MILINFLRFKAYYTYCRPGLNPIYTKIMVYTKI